MICGGKEEESLEDIAWRMYRKPYNTLCSGRKRVCEKIYKAEKLVEEEKNEYKTQST